MSDPELSTTTELERAIRSQPEQLARLAVLAGLHEPVEKLKQAHRIWLVGTGSSQHAAELGAAMLHQAGRAATAVSSMNFVNHAPPVGRQDGIVIISHNAGEETAYAASAYTIAMDAGLPVLAITRQGAAVPEALETVPKERSHTYTVSYTAVLFLLARIAGELGAEDLTTDALSRVPEAVQAAIDRPGIDEIRIPPRLLVLAGEGPAAVTAREGALKVREASRFLAEGYDAEYLLHGSAVPLGRDDHLLALAPPDTSGLVEALAHAAGAEGVRVTRLTEPASLPALLAQIPLTVRLQLLSLRFATERGYNPDLVIEGAWADEGLWGIGAPG